MAKPFAMPQFTDKQIIGGIQRLLQRKESLDWLLAYMSGDARVRKDPDHRKRVDRMIQAAVQQLRFLGKRWPKPGELIYIAPNPFEGKTHHANGVVMEIDNRLCSDPDNERRIILDDSCKDGGQVFAELWEIDIIRSPEPPKGA